VEACAGLSVTLLRSYPGLTVLATSREPLGVAGEATFGVPSLSVADSPDPVQIRSVEAVRLFVDRAGLVVPASSSPWRTRPPYPLLKLLDAFLRRQLVRFACNRHAMLARA
jgi:hypothetical protein